MAARVLLAFFAAAGLFYVPIMPALVDALKQGLGFSNRQAGLVGSLNVLWRSQRRIPDGISGAAHPLEIGRLLVPGRADEPGFAFHVPHRPSALMGVRFLHGFVGGLLVGLSFRSLPAPWRRIAPLACCFWYRQAVAVSA